MLGLPLPERGEFAQAVGFAVFGVRVAPQNQFHARSFSVWFSGGAPPPMVQSAQLCGRLSRIGPRCRRAAGASAVAGVFDHVINLSYLAIRLPGS
jgi:hypothetical protein